MKGKSEPILLKDALARGISISYEPDQWRYAVEYTYTPDFVITTRKNNYIYIEYKGDMRHFTPDYRKKWLAMYRQYSGKFDIRYIFEKDCKLPHAKNLTCTGWAAKNGLKYHIGMEIPESWLDE